MDEAQMNELKLNLCKQVDRAFRNSTIKSTGKKNKNEQKSNFEKYGDKKKYCSYCDVWITYYAYSSHNVKSKKHQKNVELYNNNLTIAKSKETVNILE